MDFILKAVDRIATDGWKLLPLVSIPLVFTCIFLEREHIIKFNKEVVKVINNDDYI